MAPDGHVKRTLGNSQGSTQVADGEPVLKMVPQVALDFLRDPDAAAGIEGTLIGRQQSEEAVDDLLLELPGRDRVLECRGLPAVAREIESREPALQFLRAGPHPQPAAAGQGRDRAPEQPYRVALEQVLRYRDHEEVFRGQAAKIELHSRGGESDFVFRDGPATDQRGAGPDEWRAKERDAWWRDTANQHPGVPVLGQDLHAGRLGQGDAAVKASLAELQVLHLPAGDAIAQQVWIRRIERDADAGGEGRICDRSRVDHGDSTRQLTVKVRIMPFMRCGLPSEASGTKHARIYSPGVMFTVNRCGIPATAAVVPPTTLTGTGPL